MTNIFLLYLCIRLPESGAHILCPLLLFTSFWFSFAINLCAHTVCLCCVPLGWIEPHKREVQKARNVDFVIFRRVERCYVKHGSLLFKFEQVTQLTDPKKKGT